MSELIESVNAIRELSPKLNALTDDMSKVVHRLNTFLNEEMKASAVVSLAIMNEDPEYAGNTRFFSYQRVHGIFRLCVVFLKDSEIEKIAWDNLSRLDKHRTFAMIPAMLRAIRDKLKLEIEFAEKSIALVKQTMKDFGIDSEPEPNADSLEDKISDFHQQRRMFAFPYIRKNSLSHVRMNLVFAKAGDKRSHKEWLANDYNYHDTCLRGYVDGTGLYFYSTEDCRAVPGDFATIQPHLTEIGDVLGTEWDTPIHEGTIPGQPGERWKPARTLGTFKELRESGTI